MSGGRQINSKIFQAGKCWDYDSTDSEARSKAITKNEKPMYQMLESTI